jgi:hypothetical protein
MTNVRAIVIIDAFLRGYKDGNDVLTLSLGGSESDGWSVSTSQIVASRIARAGKIVTIAAGNDVRRLLVHLSLFKELNTVAVG